MIWGTLQSLIYRGIIDPESLQQLKYEYKLLRIAESDTVIQYQLKAKTVKRIQITKLGFIPRSLTMFKDVKEIIFSSETIEQLPPFLPEFEGLKILIVQAKLIKEIHPNIIDLKLQTFKLEAERVNQLPADFTHFVSKIQRSLVNIHQVGEQRVQSAKDLKQLRELIKSCSFMKRPLLQYEKFILEELQILTGDLEPHRVEISEGHIVVLNLSGLNLNLLPKRLHRLKFLKSLDLSNNNFSELPLVIGKLKRLEYFTAESNQIRSIPWSFRELKWLNTINLRNNSLEELPLSMIQKRLRMLDLRENLVISLPTALLNLYQTLEVYITDNPLTKNKLTLSQNRDFQGSTISIMPGGVKIYSSSQE